MESACSRAKKSRTDFLSFQMYRLNKWLTSANPWLRQGEWEAGKEDYTCEDLFGKECWLGLDLSKTRDMSALVAIFRRENFENPDEPDFLILPWFWIPRKYADDNSTKASFLEWEAAGELEIIEGEVVRQSYIKERMNWVNENFKVQSIAYDPTFASDIINEHCEGELGWEPVLFPQSTSNFAGPTDNFEALLAGGRLKHPGNSLLSWQAGNVQVKLNEAGKKHPVKEREGVKKIDGIVASIMGLNSAYNNIGYIPQGDMYLENGWLV
jgi:phage terminase large subunit-like protein